MPIHIDIVTLNKVYTSFSSEKERDKIIKAIDKHKELVEFIQHCIPLGKDKMDEYNQLTQVKRNKKIRKKYIQDVKQKIFLSMDK